jgi:hypothetical protein
MKPQDDSTAARSSITGGSCLVCASRDLPPLLATPQTANGTVHLCTGPVHRGPAVPPGPTYFAGAAATLFGPPIQFACGEASTAK